MTDMDEKSRLRLQAYYGDHRTLERLVAHYQVEKELADRLRGANRDQRRSLYATVYDELFQRVPDHPQLKDKLAGHSRSEVRSLQKLLARYLRPHHTFLEIGAGDCAVACEIARLVTHVYAVDVSAEIVKNAELPANVELLLSDGCTIPCSKSSVDVAFSNQVMEHLHPNDAAQQLRDIYDALKPGGLYICLTPNRLSGPHDISAFFDESATGFHLKEYTLQELATLFRQVGFRRLTVLIGSRGIFLPLPMGFMTSIELPASGLRKRFGTRAFQASLSKLFLGIKLVAKK
jgi:SAM-dependent methyltransferase